QVVLGIEADERATTTKLYLVNPDPAWWDRFADHLRSLPSTRRLDPTKPDDLPVTVRSPAFVAWKWSPAGSTRVALYWPGIDGATSTTAAIRRLHRDV